MTTGEISCFCLNQKRKIKMDFHFRLGGCFLDVRFTNILNLKSQWQYLLLLLAFFRAFFYFWNWFKIGKQLLINGVLLLFLDKSKTRKRKLPNNRKNKLQANDRE
eukprot:TRINITY_DN67446_c0_g1_i13.p3 TRINITY_DN67446_c0_g1~~TRINITY_DN67446_c0_g1_i13.p3  ORF type:complete len:105 (-),score=5.05 TRINITY_DN67446_c0_g1_i13:35-349(-)